MRRSRGRRRAAAARAHRLGAAEGRRRADAVRRAKGGVQGARDDERRLGAGWSSAPPPSSPPPPHAASAALLAFLQSPPAGPPPQANEPLYRERLVFLGQEIDDYVCNQCISSLLFADAEDSSEPLFLYINSPGGSVIAGLALYDTMQHIDSDVLTCNIGMAASMARLAPPPRTPAHEKDLSGTCPGHVRDVSDGARRLALSCPGLLHTPPPLPRQASFILGAGERGKRTASPTLSRVTCSDVFYAGAPLSL